MNKVENRHLQTVGASDERAEYIVAYLGMNFPLVEGMVLKAMGMRPERMMADVSNEVAVMMQAGANRIAAAERATGVVHEDRQLLGAFGKALATMVEQAKQKSAGAGKVFH